MSTAPLTALLHFALVYCIKKSQLLQFKDLSYYELRAICLKIIPNKMEQKYNKCYRFYLLTVLAKLIPCVTKGFNGIAPFALKFSGNSYKHTQIFPSICLGKHVLINKPN